MTADSHPKILALESGGGGVSIALLTDSDCWLKSRYDSVKATRFFLPLLDQLLTEARCRPEAIDAIAFGQGPGAFTGLRTACALAQGLSVAWQKPLIAIDSLAAIAQQCGHDCVHVVIDARMQQVYRGWYARGVHGYAALTDPQLSLPETLLLTPPSDAKAGIAVAGNGLTVYPQLAERIKTHGWPMYAWLTPQARAIAQLALCRYKAGLTIDPSSARPNYVRNKVALTKIEQSRPSL